MTINTAHIGVRIVLSGSSDSPTCGDPLVDCYGAGTSDAIAAGIPGLVHIRGWSTPRRAPPRRRVVRTSSLLSGRLRGRLLHGAAATYPVQREHRRDGRLRRRPDRARSACYAKKTGAGNNNNDRRADAAGRLGRDRGRGGGFSIAAGVGRRTASTCVWQTGCDADRTKPLQRRHDGTTLRQRRQRAFSASSALDVSGPIQLLRSPRTRPGRELLPALRRARRARTTSSSRVGLKPTLENAAVASTIPLVSLKVAGGGSQNQALDCDPDLPNLRDELAAGCGARLQGQHRARRARRPRRTCGTREQPWHCVAINTGAAVGQVTQGMNMRMLGDQQRRPTLHVAQQLGRLPELHPGDPRIVEVFLDAVRLVRRQRQRRRAGHRLRDVLRHRLGRRRPARASGDDDRRPGRRSSAISSSTSTPSTTAEAGEEFCDFDAFGSCVAVLTR